MKKLYQEKLEDTTKEQRNVKTENGELTISYIHKPNVVGPRSRYTGLPIWVGKTHALVQNGEETVETVTKCWSFEPFGYKQARYISTGRLLKKLGLPTDLAEQVKD